MNILEPPIKLVDALSGWGLREVACGKYPEIQVPSDESQRTILGMEVILRHVPELIARILLAEPLDSTKSRGIFRAEFGLEDLDKLVLHSGVPLAAVDGSGNDYVRRLVETPDFTPIICTVQVAEEDTDHLVGPFAIYDGWNRAAAWLISVHEGRPYRLTAEVIKTKHPLVLGVHR